MEGKVNEMLLEALNGVGTLNISKRLIQKFQSLEKAAVLVNYIVKYQQFSKSPKFDGWFYFTHEKQMRDLFLTEQKIIKYKREFIELGILSQKMSGLPAKQWFKINEEKLIRFLYGQGRENNMGLVPPVLRGSNKLNNNKLNKRITSNSSLPKTVGFLGSDDDEETLSTDDFKFFWEAYPRKAGKGEALKSWIKICSLPIQPKGGKKPKRPTLKEILSAIRNHKKSEKWKDERFIKHPTTWLNNYCWLETLDEMDADLKIVRKRTENKPLSNMYMSNPETMKRIFDEVKAKTTVR